MILLNRINPDENVNRWYLVSVQATLFHPCALVVAWGRRDNDFQRWRVIPIENHEQAQKLVNRIVSKKVKRGYQIQTICID